MQQKDIMEVLELTQMASPVILEKGSSKLLSEFTEIPILNNLFYPPRNNQE